MADSDYVYFYTAQDTASVMFLVIAGILSALSAIFVLVFFGLNLGKRVFRAPYVFTMPIFASLMLGDLLQAIGSMLNAKWVLDGAVRTGFYCTQQGSIKQTGNISIAVWSFFIALHAFSTLFRRGKSSVKGVCLKTALGWTFILINVLLGPFMLENKTMDGPFLGVAGLWCWISDKYPTERFFLEYFFEFLSVGLSFFLYGAVFLRIRGNLYHSSSGWRLRFVPANDAWKLTVARDTVDRAVLDAIGTLIWYPLAYFVILLPIAVTRFVGFSGRSVPLCVEIMADTIFNLTGLVDALILLRLRKLCPDPEALPELFEKHQRVDFKSGTALKITPFVQMMGEDGAITRSNSMTSTNSRLALV